MVALLSPSLRALFAALVLVAGEDPTRAQAKKALRVIFDASLGAVDHGKDDAVFEVDLLVCRLARIEAEQKILAQLDTLRKNVADDILNTSELLVEPGLKALDVARTHSNTNETFHSLLAPLIDTMSNMTKAARVAAAEARAGAAATQKTSTRADKKLANAEATLAKAQADVAAAKAAVPPPVLPIDPATKKP